MADSRGYIYLVKLASLSQPVKGFVRHFHLINYSDTSQPQSSTAHCWERLIFTTDPLFGAIEGLKLELSNQGSSETQSTAGHLQEWIYSLTNSRETELHNGFYQKCDWTDWTFSISLHGDRTGLIIGTLVEERKEDGFCVQIINVLVSKGYKALIEMSCHFMK